MAQSSTSPKPGRSEIITSSPTSTHRINSLDSSSKSLLKGAFGPRVATSSSESRKQQLRNYSPSKKKIEQSFFVNTDDLPEVMVVNDIIIGKQKCRFEISDGVSSEEIISFCCDMMFHSLLGNRLEAAWQLYKKARDNQVSNVSAIKVCEDLVLSLYSFSEQEESLLILKLAILQHLITRVTSDQLRFQALEIILQILQSNLITPNIILQCIKSTTSFGRLAVKELLRLCSGTLSSSRTEEILTVLANEERFQKNCIVPSLQEELLVTQDTTSKGTLAFALGMLKERASLALESVMSTLKNLNAASSVSHQSEFLKALLVKALLNFGTHGTTGLLKLLHFTDPKIVGRAATALGYSFVDEPHSTIIPIRVIVKFGSQKNLESDVPNSWIEPLSRVEDHSKPLPEASTTEDIDKNKSQLESLWTLDYSKYVLVVNARSFMALLKASLEHRDEWLNQPFHRSMERYDEEEHDKKEDASSLEGVLKELLQSINNSSSYVRKCAVNSVGRIIKHKSNITSVWLVKESVRILKKLATEDSSPDVREAVAIATEDILQSKHKIDTRVVEISPLLQAVSSDLLLEDPFWKVRNSAASACGKFGVDHAQEILPNLVKALVNGTVSRATVAESMALLGSAGASTLLHLLSQKTASYGLQVRVHAAQALGNITFSGIQASEIEFIADQLTKICVGKDEKPLVKSAALQSLTSLTFKYKHAVPTLSPKGVIAFVYTFMKDKSKLVREAAAKIIATQKNGGFILVGAVTQDPSPVIRHTALLGLSHCGLAGLKAYILALRDSDELVRISAQWIVLGTTMETLCSELLHRSNQNRQEITEAIEQVIASDRLSKEVREKLIKFQNHIQDMPANVSYNFREYSAFKLSKQAANGLVMAPVAPPEPPFSVD